MFLRLIGGTETVYRAEMTGVKIDEKARERERERERVCVCVCPWCKPEARYLLCFQQNVM